MKKFLIAGMLTCGEKTTPDLTINVAQMSLLSSAC